MKVLSILPLAALLLGASTLPAGADWGRGHDRDRDRDHHSSHWWGHSRVGFGVGVYPGYYGYYGYSRPYYYEPGPSVVYVERDRAEYRGSVEVDVQRELRRKGYYGGAVDGDIGPQTRASIRAYQVDRGLPVTGRIDTPLLRSLRLL